MLQYWRKAAGGALNFKAPDGRSRKFADKSVTLAVTLPTSNAVVSDTERKQPSGVDISKEPESRRGDA